MSASGLVAEDAVFAVSVVLRSVVAVAVPWHVVVAVLPSIRSVLLSLFWAAVVQSDLVVLVEVHVLSRVRVFGTKSHHYFSHFLLSR